MTLNIRNQFLAYTLLIVFAIAAGLTAHAIINEYDNESKKFRNQSELAARVLGGTLANDIYFLNMAMMRRKLQGSLINPAIVSSHVFDAKGAPLESGGRDKGSDVEIFPLAELTADFLPEQGVLVEAVKSRLEVLMPVAMPDNQVVGYLVIRFSLEELQAEIKERIITILLEMATALMLGGGLALVAASHFTRPILAIRDAALAVSEGSLTARSELNRNDEIGQLSDAINAMADHLVERLTELEMTQIDLRLSKELAEEANIAISELNANLERRVDERTAELRDAQNSLVQKERLSALGQLTATVAHELRNPLGVIQNTLFTMKQTLESKGVTLERPIARIERSIGRCTRIISDLLDYSRQRELQYQERPFDEWLSGVIADQMLPANVTIQQDLRAGAIVTRFDPNRLRRVAINLIDNAVQALTEQADPKEAPVVVVGTRATENGVEIFVRDNGPGIPAEVLPRIFEPLFSTKAFGTGLGLPTVKQIVEAHGGRVDVSTTTGEGTCIRAWMPVSEERSAA